MKYLLFILALILLGFKIPLSEMKSSYGHIQAYYVVEPRADESCADCFMSLEEHQEITEINKKLMSLAYVKASSFIIDKEPRKTYLITSDHVCAEINTFLYDKRFKELAEDLMQSILVNASEEVFQNILLKYKVVPKAFVYSFNGERHDIEKIVLSKKDIDTCAIQTKDDWGQKVKLAKSGCKYEKVYNMSSTGGYYHKGTVSIREGFINGIVEELDIQGKVFKDVSLYTLTVKPGSSGSAVFNVQGEVCGSVNISFIKVDLSAGASYSDLNVFFEELKKKIL